MEVVEVVVEVLVPPPQPLITSQALKKQARMTSLCRSVGLLIPHLHVTPFRWRWGTSGCLSGRSFERLSALISPGLPAPSELHQNGQGRAREC